jgi:transposase-like protein
MEHCTKKPGDEKEIPAFGPDSIEMAMRLWIRDTIEGLVNQELDAALGAVKSARVGEMRQGYRHGARERMLTTSLGPTTIAMPRARVRGAEGTSGEWRNETVRRYQRRSTRVDEAILGVYLAGGNTRRIKGALAPLLRGGPLSKDAVSRLVGRLREDFETWRARDLADEDIRYVFMDGWYPKVRIGGRRERVPVLVTLGVRANGDRVVLDMRLVGEESAASWTEVVASLVAHHLARPVLAVIDGNPGPSSALRSHWPGIATQRCTAHKLRNLQAKVPARVREELTEDYRRMIYGETVAVVEHERTRFTKKWQLRCPAVVESLKEAGDELFTFLHLRFPRSQWKALRTTNALERINEEFRRRTKTQASLPGQDAVLLLLFGLLRSGQVKLRALVGYQDMEQAKKAA